MADKSPFLLSTEDDFAIILDALDSHCRELLTLSYTQEAIKAATQAATQAEETEEEDPKDFEKKLNRNFNKTKVKDSATRIRDKIILMKAKVVLTKEHLRGTVLNRQIEDLLGDI